MMRSRFVPLVGACMLIVAACGGVGGQVATTTTATPSHASTTVTEPPSTPVRLAYGLEAGRSFTYLVGFEIAMEMTVTGDASSLSDDGEYPGDLDALVTGSTTLTYMVADGPEPGTFEITITGDFEDLSVTGTADGEPIDAATLPELAAMEPVEVTLVVDERGNVVGDATVGGDIFGSGLGELPAPGADIGRFVGPPLADVDIDVGSTWSETVDTPMLFGDSLTTRIDSVVTGIRDDGMVEIETTMLSSAISFDLGAFLAEMFDAFIPEGATEEELAQIEQLKASLKFLFDIDEASNRMTTIFDPAIGLAVQAGFEGDTHVVMDVNMPDETTGEIVAFLLDMTMTQNVTYELIGPPGG